MADYRCPYCGRHFDDAITRSQHVRKCPDGPNPVRRLAVGRLTKNTTRMTVPHDRIPEMARDAASFRAAGYELTISASPAVLNGRAADTGARVILRRPTS